MTEDNIAPGKFQVITKAETNAKHLAQFHTILISAVLYICFLTKNPIHFSVNQSLAGFIG